MKRLLLFLALFASHLSYGQATVVVGTLVPYANGTMVETPTHWIGFGFADSLDAALVACLRGMINWTSRTAKIDRRDIYPLCSMAASFRVTQYSNQTGSVYTTVPPHTVH